MALNYFKFLKASILSSIDGWVDHKLDDCLLFLNGLAIYIFSVALLATFNWFGSTEIFWRAEINPSGFLVNSIAVASDRNLSNNPVVTQITAFWEFLPVAKALGWESSTTW